MVWLPIKATNLTQVAPILVGAELDATGEDARWVGWYWGDDFAELAKDPLRERSTVRMWFGELLPGSGLQSFNLPRKLLRRMKELEKIVVPEGRRAAYPLLSLDFSEERV